MKRKSSASKKLKNNNNRVLKKIALVILVALLGGLYVGFSRANQIPANQIALLNDDPNTPYVLERVKVGNKYEVKTTSQPISFIATTQGDMYCKLNENQMKKVKIGQKAMKLLTSASASELSDVKKTEDVSRTKNNVVDDTLLVNDGDRVNVVAVGDAKKSKKYSKLISNIKQKCDKATEKIKSSELPQFGLPKVNVKVSELTSLEKIAGVEAVEAASTLTLDTKTEADQLYRVNLNRLANNTPPALTRYGCIDTVARDWSRWLAAIREYGYGLAHNPNFGTQIIKKCNLTNWKKIGENVGSGSNSEIIFRALKDSKGHRENYLSKDYSRIGIGAYRTSYDNRLLITQNFVGMQ